MYRAMASATRTAHITSDRASEPDAVFAAHVSMLHRYLYVLGALPDRRDDLIQEVFLLVLRRKPKHDNPRAFGAFLRGCAKNLLMRERRSAGARREVELADEVWREATEQSDQRLDALRTCVDTLPLRSRQLLESTYAEGLGRIDAGRRVGLGSDGVKTTLRRLRASLRDCVERRLRGES